MKELKNIEGLMDYPSLLTKVEIENYLLVHLGLRSCLQITLPAELPDAEALGAAIDGKTYPHKSQVRDAADPRKRHVTIDAVKSEMRAAFEDVV